MDINKDDSCLQDAEKMLDAFVGVGATHFDLTITNRLGDKVRFQRGQSASDLRNALPTLLSECNSAECNIILRPRAPCFFSSTIWIRRQSREFSRSSF